ncbi:SIR2 family protein [Acinetobacter sp.]|uniref:SIR2 family protein n=1 Tax=Acinetobacter sp. TaxID=472 RepID=UPI0031D53F28
MRFTKTGPNIPDELIDAQKNGELLFFCGAGVSVPAGLPTFYQLTENVANKLHALDDKNNEISELLKNNQFDRTFSALKRLYGDEVVDAILLNELKVTSTPLLSNHENLLKLSINEKKKPFLITTNFDLLFEKVDKKLKSFVPPYLPDLKSKEELSGIVYLHGKWIDHKKKQTNNLIISSQDFGSAYLSHGWATRFLSNLLTRRTVVLIGYSGDDILVRYLLEGLNAEQAKNKIYAFERGEQGKISQKWSQLGATGISYPNHPDLWDTITEWAKYSGEEDKWNNYILGLSKKSPKELEAFERGQVANFISTIKGAQKFQQFNPLPKAEWIYVFDKYIRLGDSQILKNENGQETVIDPIELYGTDIDPSRFDLMLSHESLKNKIGQDYIGELLGNSNTEKVIERLSNLKYENLWNIDSRITNLAKWIVKVSEQPSIIWWTQKQNNIHPLILRGIENRIADNPEEFQKEVLAFWENYILSTNLSKKQPALYNWYNLKNDVRKKNNHFSELNLNYLETFLTPSLVLNTFYSKDIPYLPTNLEEQCIIKKFEIDFPYFHSELIEVHKESLYDVIEIISRAILLYIRFIKYLKNDAEEMLFSSFYFPAINFLEPLKPLRNVNKKIGKIILWIHHLIKELCQYDEKKLFNIVKKWPKNDNLIFNRLRLYIWTITPNINKWSIEKSINEFPLEFFSDRYIESYFLIFISKQWDYLNLQNRIKIEEKIISSNKIKVSLGTEDKDIEYQNYLVGRKLAAIEKTKVGLTEKGENELLRIRKSENWQDDFIDQPSLVPGMQVGFVSTNTQINEIETIDDSTLFFEKVQMIESNSITQFERKDPFKGYVKNHTLKALNKLLIELKLGNERPNYWNQFFENIDQGIDKTIIKEVAQSILILSKDIIFQCRYSLTRWLNDSLNEVCIIGQNLFLTIWDYIFDSLNSYGDNLATESALGNPYSNNNFKKPSRKTFNHALNSPIGMLVLSLFESYDIQKRPNYRVNNLYLLKIIKSLTAVGEGSDHAIIIIMRNFNFMYRYNKNWTENNLIKFLDVNNSNSEAAWNGFMTQNSAPTNKAIILIKPYLISLFKSKPDWTYSETFEQNLSSLFTSFCYFSYPKKIIFQDVEIRNLIRLLNEDMRSYVIWSAFEIIKTKENWKKFGRYFFKNLWPKEIHFQTSKTSERIFDFLLDQEENFIDILKHTRPYLMTIDANSLFLYKLIDENKPSQLVKSYPYEIIDILDKIIGTHVAHYDLYLNIILDSMATSKPNIKNHPSWRRLKDITKN